MVVEISVGTALSLLRTVHRIGEGVLPFFFHKRLEVIAYSYGRLKDDQGVDDNHALLVGLKFVNSSQKPLLVTDVQASLDGKALENMGTSARKRGIRTSRGWRILDQPREQLASFPFQVAATDVVDNRFVCFRIPDLTERSSSTVQVKIEASFALHIGASALLEFKPEPVLPNK